MQLAAIVLAAVCLQGQTPTTPPPPPESKISMIDMVLGKGSEAADGDLITVDYTGNLLDGTVFDSSTKGAPIAFRLGAKEVIPGWDQGLQGMRVGGRRVLSIPPALGYGAVEKGSIPPNSTLVFDVRMLRIDKKGTKPMIEIEEEKEGEGPEAKTGDTVEINYTGKFLNGNKFDSSHDRNQTFSFKLGAGQVIKGFDQGVTGMKKGGKRKVTIPPELGYGERGAGGVIPPNSTLVFELELVSIK